MPTSSFIFINVTKLRLCGSPSRPASEMVRDSMSGLLWDAWGPSRRETEGTGCWGAASTEGSHTLSGPAWPPARLRSLCGQRQEGYDGLLRSLLMTFSKLRS